MKKTFLLLLAFTYMLTIVSCSKDPVEPEDETEHVGHDQWHKVVFELREGHLHGSSFHGNPIYPNSPLQRYQSKTYALNSDGTISVDNDNPFYVIENRYYALEIKYYDKEGTLINPELASEEMAPIHQHFFTAKEADLYKENTTITDTKSLYGYAYRDTDPVDVQLGNFIPNTTRKSKLRSNDPLGFKGYFSIKKAYVEWDMKVRLVHITEGDKFDNEGNPYAFNNPPRYMLGTTDLNLDIPFKSITSTPQDSNESWNTYIKDIAEEFDLTIDQVEDGEDPDTVDTESSQYWM